MVYNGPREALPTATTRPGTVSTPKPVVYNGPRDALPTAMTRAGTVLTPKPVDEEILTLLPKEDGFGDYQINHIICYFTIADMDVTGNGEEVARSLTKAFGNVENFCSIFSHHNIASAAPGRHLPSNPSDRNNGTVLFEIGGNFGEAQHKLAGLMHPDWVVMRTDVDSKTALTKSFYANTLKRNWQNKFEDSIKSKKGQLLLLLVSGILGMSLAHFSVPINQRHFLAGSRSWRVGYDDKSRKFFVESVTVERFSDIFYAVLAEGVLNYQDAVPKIWSHLLNNYIKLSRHEGHELIFATPPDEASWEPAGYKPSKDINPHILFKWSSYKPDEDGRLAAGDAAWARVVIKNHKGLSEHVK
jgi:hypothetical protein